MLAGSLDRARQVLPPDHPAVAVAAARYGACLMRFGRLDEAERLLDPSRLTLANLGDPEAKEATRHLIELYRRTGRAAAAAELADWLAARRPRS